MKIDHALTYVKGSSVGGPWVTVVGGITDFPHFKFITICLLQ